MNIWILNHYAVPQKYYYLARSFNFAKELIARGNTVTIFAASSAHNSDVNLIEDKRQYTEMDEDGIHYVLFRGRQYEGSGKRRVINHMEVARRMERLCPDFVNSLGKPDVIFASAGQSLTLVAGIKLAKKLGVRCVSEITDLWPESFVAYGLIDKKNPLLKLLYAGERWIYKKSDALIFSMEGGRDYIIEHGWDTEHGGPIDLSKVYHINNGVDLAAFDYNKEHYTFADEDLDDPDTFKVVYTGSIREVNDVGQLVDAAECLTQSNENKIKLIIFGDGTQLQQLRDKAAEMGLENIVFKGRVDKKYIPYVLSKCDLCLLHWKPSPIMKYGLSMNKLFDYLAAGIPVLSNSVTGYDIIQRGNCGVSINITSPEQYAREISNIAAATPQQYNGMCKRARALAEEYDFKVLVDKLLAVIKIHL